MERGNFMEKGWADLGTDGRVPTLIVMYIQRIRIRSSKSQIKTLHMGCRIEGMSSNTGGKSKRWSLTEGGGKSCTYLYTYITLKAGTVIQDPPASGWPWAS
ncbi:uncharacterized protein H6S33_012618 [Morchella sextelata]|uniref:uncharacterized protein n=1 Tax=Morchella sextelata TaxID=1174677 RepID=UPI001D03DB7F|nr:uncharacterized protein H6S33_012618 [Morchella sextelata]KAH0610072.1 hypothetical protein H6S33_012618 [Morchella sextelata]